MKKVSLDEAKIDYYARTRIFLKPWLNKFDWWRGQVIFTYYVLHLKMNNILLQVIIWCNVIMCLCNAQEKTTPSCCCCGQYVKLLIKAVTNLQANVKINKVTDVSHLSHTFTFMTMIMFYISLNLTLSSCYV